MLFKAGSFLAHTALLTGLLCFATHPVSAESLGQAVEAALNNHPSVEAAIANRDATIYERRERMSDLLPKLNVRGTGGRMYGDNSTSRGLSVTRGAGYSYLWEGSVTMSQTLFDGFETYRRIDAAESRRGAANQNILDSRETLTMSVVLTYLDVLRGRETLVMMENHHKKIEDYRQRIREMVDSGAADETIAVQANDIQVQLENTIANIKGQVAGAIAAYQELTGHVPETSMSLPEVPHDRMPENIDLAVDIAKQSHPMLQSAIMEEQAAEYDADAEKGTLYPDLTGELSYLKKDQADIIGGEVVDAKAIVRMNWNLSLGGGDIARMKGKERRAYEAKAQRAELERKLEKEVRKSWADMQTSKIQLALMNKRRELNENLLETNKAQFEVSRVNLLQLMQSENALFNSKIALLNADYRYIASQFVTLANIGKLQDALHVVSMASNDR